MKSSNFLFGVFSTVLLSSTSAHAATLQLSTETPKQGTALKVSVGEAEDGSEKVVLFNNEKYKMFPVAVGAAAKHEESESNADGTGTSATATAAGDGTLYTALIGIPVTMKPGTYTLTAGGVSKKIKVVDAKYPVQYLTLPKSKDNFITSPGEEEAVEAAKGTVSAERSFKCPFVKPSKCRQSAAFGLRRVVNGKLLDDYFHSGLDFAAPQGSPIVATAGGTVILAHNGWRLHGNIVGIDHGQGVISFYLHMQKILVKEGQKVASGEKIGLVGQTGRASGPHLHFSIYVNKVATDPKQWFQASF